MGDLENVLYEACNEASGESTAWQYDLIRFVQDYERSKPQQHPVGMTFQYRGGSNSTLFESPADWISPNPGDNTRSYIENPCSSCTTKVVVNDTDDLWGHTGGDNIRVWKSFTRGLNVLFMEGLHPSPTRQDSARSAMGQIRRYGDGMNLAAMAPDEKVPATRFCLAAELRNTLSFSGTRGSSPLTSGIRRATSTWSGATSTQTGPRREGRCREAQPVHLPLPSPVRGCST